MFALPYVATEDQPSGTGLHRLAGLLSHRIVIGLAAAGDEQQRPARRTDNLVDRMLA